MSYLHIKNREEFDDTDSNKTLRLFMNKNVKIIKHIN